MHFVTGGAFNGKAAWVKNYYELQQDCYWVSFYQELTFQSDLPLEKSVIVFEGLEYKIKEDLQHHDSAVVQENWRIFLQQLRDWEQEKLQRKVVLIGADMTKGIVPMERVDRVWRDTAGRVFQMAASVCERVDLIWYGIGQQLK